MNHPEFTLLRRQIDEAITFNDLEEAKRSIAKGLDLAQRKECPGEMMYFKAQLEIIDGNFKEAIAYLDKALQFNPEDGAAYNDKALCLVELGKIEGVLDFFDKGISVEPDYATIHHNRGWFLNKLGQHEDALVAFRKALEIEPGRAVTYENMGEAYERVGRLDLALKSLEDALECLKPFYADIRGQIISEIRRLRLLLPWP